MKATLALVIAVYAGSMVFSFGDMLLPATVALVVTLAVFCFRPPEKKKSGYRWIVGMLAALSMGTACDWFIHYEVALLYFREQSPRLLIVPVMLLSALSLALIWELSSLSLHRRRVASEPNG